MTRRTAAALPGLDRAGESKDIGGPVYQGVCSQIRALFPSARDRGHLAKCVCEECEGVAAAKAVVEGSIAQARSLAASIDRASGHGGTRQASGVQLSAMHDSLDRLLDRLSPDGEGDAFDELREDMRRAEEEARVRAAEASHPEV